MSSSDSNVFRNAVTNVSTIQHSKIPLSPDIFSPYSVLMSFFSYEKEGDTFIWLKQIVENHRSKLDDINLSGIKLNNTFMPHGNFEKSDLWDSNFTKSAILYCNFKNTNLRVARFDGAIGHGANFSESKLEKTNFNSAYLPQSFFQKIDADQASFKNSLLVQANFNEAKLAGVDFSNASLVGAFFRNAIFNHVNFKDTLLVGADFSGSNIKFEDLIEAKSLYAT